MRKLVIALVATAAMLFAGSVMWKADATTGTGTQGLPATAKDYSLVDTVACRFSGPTCPIGYTRVCRLVRCWCARCRY
jgi:hypothetical protein